MSHPCHPNALATRPGVVRAARAPFPSWSLHLLVALAVVVAVVLAGAGRLDAQTGPQSAEPKSWIVVDADTGAVIAGKNIHDAVPPASTAKIMTALVAVERFAPDTLVTVSERAAGVQASADNPIRLQPGEQWRFADLLSIVMLLSGNDASYAIAEQTGGSVDAFADAMNTAAERLGMRDSTFNDPAGFSDATAFDGGPHASAFDLAIATRNALAVPQLATLAAATEIDITDSAGNARTIETHNRLLTGQTRAYEGATGFKTGYTARSGHTLVATASRAGRDCIAVVLDTYDVYGWAIQMLDQCFASAPGAGTGEALPDVGVSSFEQRVTDRDGFVELARGDAIAAPPADAQGVGFVTPTSPTRLPSALDTRVAGEAQGPAPGGDDGSTLERLFTTRNAVVGGGGLLVVLVVLRRRAVKRHRARRLARRRQMAAAMRRGSLLVVDGRYRAGTRMGPPMESHMQVHRVERGGQPRHVTRHGRTDTSSPPVRRRPGPSR